MCSRFVNGTPHLFKHASYTHLQHGDRDFTLLNMQFEFAVWVLFESVRVCVYKRGIDVRPVVCVGCCRCLIDRCACALKAV